MKVRLNRYFSLAAALALAGMASNAHAADAEVELKAGNDRPNAQAELEIDRDKRADTSLERQSSRNDADKVTKANKATGLLGMEVRNSNDEKLGEVKDLVVDLGTGKISYAVLAVGGFLGIGEKLLALPPSALKANQSMTHLTLDADRAKIEAAPGFAATAWPSVSNPEADQFWSGSAVGAPAIGESDRDRSRLKADQDLKIKADVDTKKKIYTDADEKKIEIDVDKD